MTHEAELALTFAMQKATAENNGSSAEEIIRDAEVFRTFLSGPINAEEA